LLVCAAYVNALFGSFQFDDYKVIVDYPGVHSWQAWLDGVGHGIRPLLKLSYTLNWVTGLGAVGFHLVNGLIHLGSAWLVYRLAEEFLRCQHLHPSLEYVPLLTALLFAVHPIQTESVTYICGRSSSLMALFYLAGLLAYARGRSLDRKTQLYALTPALFVLALAVKETAVTFPAVLLLWELFCGGRFKASFRRQWPTWAVLFGAALFFLLHGSYLEEMQTSAELGKLPGNVAKQLLAFAYLMRQWALPLWLNIDPDLPLVHDFSDAAGSLAFSLGAGALVLACWRRRPWISFALLWAGLHLMALYLFLPRVDVANERQMYLASWPLFLALSIEMALWLRPLTFRLAATALLLALAGLTVARNQVYANEITLWEDTAAKSPHKARVHNNLGYAYLLAERREEARREFATALQLDPQQIQSRFNLERLNAP
jgi:tetratricopeptide (TPR) repeat protein